MSDLRAFSLQAGGGLLVRRHAHGVIIEYNRIANPASIVLNWSEATRLKEELESLGATSLPPRTEY